MNFARIRPSTLDGIKQLATKIKREKKINHAAALELASRHAGFENFVHARRQLSVRKVRYGVYLSAHWYVSVKKSSDAARRGGRELLFFELEKPLLEVIAKHRVGYAKGLFGFRMEYEDHLEHQTNFDSQDSAREALVRAVGSLRFMEFTGLQPITTQPLRNAIRELDDLPRKDHLSGWFDPATKDWVVMDEPYQPAVAGVGEQRRMWVALRGFHMVKTSWEGLHNPGLCQPHLIGKSAAAIERLGLDLENLSPTLMPDPWPFESGLCGDDFVSPKREADCKTRRPRPGRSYFDHKGARPYGGRPGVASKWRPVQSLSLEQHDALGALFYSLSLTRFSSRVSYKLQSYYSRLEDWAFNEHGEDAPNDLYFGRGSVVKLGADVDVLAALCSAREIIESGYNDCKPRRELVVALSAAIDEVRCRMA